MIDFSTFALWENLLVFAASAVVIWVAGTKTSRYAYAISQRTGIGTAILGLLLLGGITSLPEVAVSIAAGAAGDTALAVNTLLGGVALQVTVLALADAVHGKDALSSVVVQPVILLQAALDILLLVAVAAGITIGEVGVFGIGIWATTVFMVYLLSIWLVNAYQVEPGWEAHDRWIATRTDTKAGDARAGEAPGGNGEGGGGERDSLRRSLPAGRLLDHAKGAFSGSYRRGLRSNLSGKTDDRPAGS